jgi:hypothetical protein
VVVVLLPEPPPPTATTLTDVTPEGTVKVYVPCVMNSWLVAHDPFTHAAPPLQTVPQVPQLLLSVSLFDSQPSVLVPSQSW